MNKKRTKLGKEWKTVGPLAASASIFGVMSSQDSLSLFSMASSELMLFSELLSSCFCVFLVHSSVYEPCSG